MNKPSCMAWVPVLLLSSAVLAQSAGATDPAGTTLAFKFKQGDVTRYKHKVNMEMRSATLPGGKTAVMEEYIETNTVLSVEADGSAEVESIASSFVQKVDGEKTTATRSMLSGIPQDTPIIHHVLKNGKIQNSRVGKDLSLADKIKTEAALRNMRDHGFQLPEHGLPMGGSWNREEIISNKIPGLGVMDTKLSMNYTLSSEEDILGFPCVKILLAGSGTGAMGEGKGSNQITLKGILWFAPDLGDLVKMTVEHAEKLKLVGPKGSVEVNTSGVETTQLIP